MNTFPTRLKSSISLIDRILTSANKINKSSLIDQMSSDKYISFQDETDIDEENDDIIVKAFYNEQDIDTWIKFHKSSGKEIFKVCDIDDDLILVASMFSQDWTTRFLAEKFGEVQLEEIVDDDNYEEIIIRPAERLYKELKTSEEKKVKEEIVKAPREVKELKIRTEKITEEEVAVAKEAASELRELLEGIEKLADQIKADEKDTEARMEEFIKSRGTEESKRKLQNDMNRLTTMLQAAGKVVKINADKVLGLVEDTELEPILSKAVKDKLKAMKAEHTQIRDEYEKKAGAQMEEVKKIITQRIVEFPIKPEILKGNRHAFLKDILKKIWGFLSGWTGKLHDFSEEIDELQVMIEEETPKEDVGEVYRGK